MNRASSRLLRRLQGTALAYAAYASVMLAAACGLWAIGAHEYQARLERMEHESGDVASSIEMLIGTCIDHVDMLRHQAEALLGESSTSYASRRLFAGLKPSRDFPAMRWTACPGASIRAASAISPAQAKYRRSRAVPAERCSWR